MKLIALIVSIVLFIVAALIGFSVITGDFDGWLASGLVALAISFLPLAERPAL